MASVLGDGTISITSSTTASGTLYYGTLNGNLQLLSVVTGNIVDAPAISIVEARTENKIRVTFDQPMIRDSRLIDKTNYEVTPSSDGVSIFIENIIAEDTTYSNYVDLITNEMTNLAGYQLYINIGGNSPVSKLGLKITATGNTYSFTGNGRNPTISYIEALSENIINVVFDEIMLDNGAIRDKDNYVFDNELTAINIVNVSEDTVQITTSNQTPGELYTLTIN
jgi:hypothetical protein